MRIPVVTDARPGYFFTKIVARSGMGTHHYTIKSDESISLDEAVNHVSEFAERFLSSVTPYFLTVLKENPCRI